jgi:hypothetical protein
LKRFETAKLEFGIIWSATPNVLSERFIEENAGRLPWRCGVSQSTQAACSTGNGCSEPIEETRAVRPPRGELMQRMGMSAVVLRIF